MKTLFVIGLILFTFGRGSVFAQKNGVSASPCSTEGLKLIAREELANVLKGSEIPGVTAAIYIPTRFRRPVAIASGWSDYAAERQMMPDNRILAGSIGKTFYAAAALRLIDKGKLELDKTIADYLPTANIPAADRVTVRMLLSHRTGYGEYDAVFMEDLIKDPTRVRVLDDWVGPLRRNQSTKPGEFRYSDINFVILAHIIDRVAGTPATNFINSQFLKPYRLRDTEPSNQRKVAGLVQGYAGPKNFFGRDTMIDTGSLIYNPQFESGGGGYVSNSADLARWITLFGTSTLFSLDRWNEASTPTHKDEKKDTAYGLGIHIDSTPLGIAYGHSGYIPGYVSWARWYEKQSIAVAIQTNTSDHERLSWDGYDVSDRIVKRVDMACHKQK
ncbi:MAG: serine hydrolase domain-containing protein [Pyrinomonadaceae bacterium]